MNGLPVTATASISPAAARAFSASSVAAYSMSVAAPSVFGQAIVLPLLSQLLEVHPELRVDLDLSDRVVDIVGQGLDLALRVATLDDSELVAKRLASNPRIICAAPRYLQRHGQPATLAALDEHQCVVLHALPRWPLVIDGHLQRRRVNARVITSSVEAARTATVQGLGLAMLCYWDVHEHLAAGSLVAIELADVSMEDLSVWAVTPTRRYVPTRVKIFVEALENALRRIE